MDSELPTECSKSKQGNIRTVAIAVHRERIAISLPG